MKRALGWRVRRRRCRPPFGAKSRCRNLIWGTFSGFECANDPRGRDDDNTNLVNAQRFDSQANKIGGEFTVKSGAAGPYNDEAGLLADGPIAYALRDNSANDYDVMTSIWSTADDDFAGDYSVSASG